MDVRVVMERACSPSPVRVPWVLGTPGPERDRPDLTDRKTMRAAEEKERRSIGDVSPAGVDASTSRPAEESGVGTSRGSTVPDALRVISLTPGDAGALVTD